MGSKLAAGRTLPDYELPDHTRTPRKLSDLQGDDPLILTLARGHYCPKEHQQHQQLAAFYSQIAVAYTQIATISTDDHHTSQEFRASVGAQWPFLSDPERTVQQDLDIQEYTDPKRDPMIPHTLVLKPGLVVHSVYNGYWFWGRPSVEDLRRDLRAVTSEIRRDWDLSAPGLREAWDAGDVSAFHGWSKWSPERIKAERAEIAGTRMSVACSHLDTIQVTELPANIVGCEDCIAIGSRWVHLRMCQSCGRIGCCDSSPNRHASAHARETGHPIVRSAEPGEDWSYCYPDDIAFVLGP